MGAVCRRPRAITRSLVILSKCHANRSTCSYSRHQSLNFIDFTASPATLELRSFAGGWVGVPKKKSLTVYSVGGSRYFCMRVEETGETGNAGHLGSEVMPSLFAELLPISHGISTRPLMPAGSLAACRQGLQVQGHLRSPPYARTWNMPGAQLTMWVAKKVQLLPPQHVYLLELGAAQGST